MLKLIKIAFGIEQKRKKVNLPKGLSQLETTSAAAWWN
ncbi:hypothetical protein SAMN02745129_3995 [Ferrimonas marina]|uniref:Uncharacterized protein n=1 Tax=Ferrimonas marina TaxID=299255 RepID=A0A1M5Y9V7_9GAMM|nr:hypothetical protein SAMN02745129_3995 [Ferrimonas marina]